MKLFVLSAIILSHITGYGQTVSQVLAAHLKAMGGSEALASVNTRTMEAGLETPNGEITVRYAWKRGGYYFSEMKMPDGNALRTLVRPTDGQLADPGGIGQPNAEHLADLRSNEADLDGVLIGHEKKGHTVVLNGSEKLGGKDCHKLDVKLKSGVAQTYWIDKSSGLIVRYRRTVINAMGEVELTRDLLDYKSVAGVMYPFLFKSTFGQAEYSTKIKSIKVNEPVADSTFEDLK